ncbi:unnamed protein product [Protopolystoma xenopodis]|uniref:Uncharacterized protein n=1 Tax=Protopolystoma xenopodis TaxID=117903 RepID=A0A448WBZ1_9PLAT|nr:unnamed protein product [Protopolystoma xenopodis]
MQCSVESNSLCLQQNSCESSHLHSSNQELVPSNAADAAITGLATSAAPESETEAEAGLHYQLNAVRETRIRMFHLHQRLTDFYADKTNGCLDCQVQ